MAARRPRFADSYHVDAVPGVGVFLVGESDYYVLSGRLHLLVAPYLDGRLTDEEIAARLDGQASAAEVHYVLMQLEAKGYVVEAAPELDVGVAAFWNRVGVQPGSAAARLAESVVGIRRVGDLSEETESLFTAELGTFGVQVSAAEAGLTVALTDDYLQDGLAEIDRRARETGRPWLPVKPVGSILWFGPLFVPGRTACWHCLAQRLSGLRKVEAFVQEQTGRTGPLPTARARAPAVLRAGLALAAGEVAKIVVGDPGERLRGTMVTLDAARLATRDHTVVRRPQCPACGDPALGVRLEHPIELASRRKAFTADGGHRTAPPEDTYERYRHHVSPYTGVVKWLTRSSDPGDALMHTYSAGHNFAMLRDDLAFLRMSLRANAGGKGKTDAQARASALCEALERYSGVYQGGESARRASYSHLGGEAIHPRACLLFSERQYRERDEWNRRYDRYQFVPLPFDEDAQTDWTPVWSLTNRRTRLLPTACCFYGYMQHPAVRSSGVQRGFAFADSNGAAAGNSLEEAILQGLLELVERDGVALWWYNRVQRPGVDLDSFGDPYLVALRERYAALRRDLWAIDLTGDSGIPVFAALSRRLDPDDSEEIVFGTGAHLDPSIALLRAVTEVSQFVAGFQGFLTGSDRYAGFEADAVRWWRSATLAGEPYLAPSTDRPLRRAAEFRRLDGADLRDDVMTCVATLARLGLETFILDQTRPDVGLPVVKVVVPGLRHFWARLAPGRLYDVPVELGWLERPRAESEMNPTPVFF